MEPCASVSPIIVRCALGNSERLRSFPQRHADEITQLYQFGFARVLRSQSVQRLMDGKHFVLGAFLCGQLLFIKRSANLAPAMADGAFAPGFINENSAHGFSGRRKKMSPVGKFRRPVACQAQPCLMNQRRGLQGLAGRFSSHFFRRQLAQLFIDHRQQFVRRMEVAALDGFEDSCNVAQGGKTMKKIANGLGKSARHFDVIRHAARRKPSLLAHKSGNRRRSSRRGTPVARGAIGFSLLPTQTKVLASAAGGNSHLQDPVRCQDRRAKGRPGR